MKKRALAALAIGLGGLVSSYGQGLLSIGNTTEDFDTDIPLTWTATVNVGYDDNPETAPEDEDEAWYVQGGIGARYAGGSRVTRHSLGASFSLLWYDRDLQPDNDDLFYNARFSYTMVHRPSRRLTLSNNFYVTYEIEPDADIGATRSRRTDQYFYAYDRFAVSYAWTRRFSTVTSLLLTGIYYDSDSVEDRYSFGFGQEFRYLWTRVTTLVGEYRFLYTDFEESPRDYADHFVLVGADHAFSRVMRGTIRLGAQFRNGDDISNRTSPFVEASLIHMINEGFSIRVFGRYGFEDSELGSYEFRESFRTGFSTSYEFTPRLVGSAGLQFIHSEFQDSVIAGVSDADEDYFGIYLGLSYLLYSNVRLNAGWSYSDLDSDRDFSDGFSRDYDRNKVYLGVSATF